MLTFMPSIYVGLAGIVLTAILLAAEWYIWDFRYWITRQRAPELARFLAADGKDAIHVASASGRDLVATLAPQSPQGNTLPFHPVEGGRTELWGQL